MTPRLVLQGRRLLPIIDRFYPAISPENITHVHGLNFGFRPGQPGATVRSRYRHEPIKFTQLALTTANPPHLEKASARGPRRRRGWRQLGLARKPFLGRSREGILRLGPFENPRAAVRFPAP